MSETNGNEAVSSLTLESARELLQQHIARISAEYYQIGRILNEVEDRRLAGVGTYKAAMKHLGPAVLCLSVRDLHRAQAASRRFSEAAFVKYGAGRLSLLAQYGRRCKRDWAEGALEHMSLRVPGEDKKLRGKPFPDCTPEEVGRAIARERTQEEVIPLPSLEEYCIHLLRERIRKRFAEDSSANIKAFVREGKPHVTLRDVSMTELRMLAQAILESIVPLELETYRGTLRPLPGALPGAAPSLHSLPGASASATAPRAP